MYDRTPSFRVQPDCRLLRSGAGAAVILGLGITGLNLIHVNAYILLLGPALVLAGILAVRPSQHEADRSDSIDYPVTNVTSLAVQASFWLLIAWAALIAHGAATERPLEFFIVVAVAWALLAVRTMEKLEPVTIASILFGAILLSLVVRGSVFFLTPGFPGSDAWAHEQLTQAILTSGHVPAEWESPYYLHYPALHLTVATTALLTGTSSKVALFAAIGIPLVLSAVAVFTMASRLTSPRIALLATLLVLSSSYHLQWGTQIIPTSLGLTLFTLSLMLCLRPGPPRRAETLLLLLTATALVLSHTVSSFVLWTTLLVLVATSIILRVAFHSSSLPYAIQPMMLMALFLTITMFLHWSTNPYMYSGESFLEWMLTAARESIRADAGFLERPWDNAAHQHWAPELAAVSSFGLFYFLVTLGALRALRGDRPHSGLIAIAAATALLSIFVFAFPLFGIRTILPHRWFAFIWVPAAVLTAIGLCRLSGAFSSAGIVNQKAVLAGVAGLLAFLMISAPVSNTDSPIIAPSLTQRLCFYNSETSAANWLTHKCDGLVAADQQFGTRVLRDATGMSQVSTAVPMDGRDLPEYYLWRSTSLLQPIQTQGSTSVILGTHHVLDVEEATCAVYATKSSTVFAATSALRHGEGGHAS